MSAQYCEKKSFRRKTKPCVRDEERKKKKSSLRHTRVSSEKEATSLDKRSRRKTYKTVAGCPGAGNLDLLYALPTHLARTSTHSRMRHVTIKNVRGGDSRTQTKVTLVDHFYRMARRKGIFFFFPSGGLLWAGKSGRDHFSNPAKLVGEVGVGGTNTQTVGKKNGRHDAEGCGTQKDPTKGDATGGVCFQRLQGKGKKFKNQYCQGQCMGIECQVSTY